MPVSPFRVLFVKGSFFLGLKRSLSISSEVHLNMIYSKDLPDFACHQFLFLKYFVRKKFYTLLFIYERVIRHSACSITARNIKEYYYDKVTKLCHIFAIEEFNPDLKRNQIRVFLSAAYLMAVYEFPVAIILYNNYSEYGRKPISTRFVDQYLS